VASIKRWKERLEDLADKEFGLKLEVTRLKTSMVDI
jgi:hypothetical protein